MINDTVQALRGNILLGALALAAIHLVGTLGFHAIDHANGGTASWFDAFYMTFITVATIGYAETVNIAATPWGRLFNVGIAITGIGFLWVIFSNFTALLLATTTDPMRQRARLLKEIARMNGHFIVCGLGRVGTNVVRELWATGHEAVAVEVQPAAIDAFQQHVGPRRTLRALQADACDDDTLLAAGLAAAGGVFAVTGDDSENMLIALSSKQLNPRARVVARVHDVRNVDKCRRAGADEIVSPDFAGALRMASAMLRPQATGFVDGLLNHPDAMRLVDVTVPAGSAPRPLGDLQLRDSEYLVVGLRRDRQFEVNPGPETALDPGAVLIALATPAGLDQLRRRIGSTG